MGNIRIHLLSGSVVEAHADHWMTALLLSMTEAQVAAVVRNLERIKREELKILKPTPGMDGKIILPR